MNRFHHVPTLLGAALLLATLGSSPATADDGIKSARAGRETLHGTSILAQTDDPVGPPKPVFVVNTDATPVPVTGNVRGECEITNTPEVIVTNAVPVPKTPFNVSKDLQILDIHNGGHVDVFTVPMGKQLVLTRASFAMNLPDDQELTFTLDLLDSSVFAVHYFQPAQGGTIGSLVSGTWFAGAQLEILLAEGESFRCGAIRDSTDGDAQGRCTLSGYLMDTP